MNKENTGAPWKPLTGLIDPFESGPDSDENNMNFYDKDKDSYDTQSVEETTETFESPSTKVVRSQENTPIEKIFLYVAILLCIGLLVALVYWVMNNHLFYSLLIVLVSVILYCLVYIANFKDYIENTNTHTKVTSGWTIVTLALTTMMLFIVVRNKGRFTH
jgi:hypothetical protein